jgi:hypothetical protein
MEVFKFFASIAAVFALIWGLAIGASWYVDHRECVGYRDLTNRTIAYSFYTGCLVKTDDGRWITLKAATSNSSDVTVREGK